VPLPATPGRVASLLASNNVLLAPMAGVTEAPFRAVCKRAGAGLTYTEMISAVGLHYNPDSRVSKALLTFAPEERPCVVQLFGAIPSIVAEQAASVVRKHGSDVAFIDINMGCPVTKVVAKGEGSALMRDMETAAHIVSSVTAACEVPVTVKIRKGWDHESVNAVEFAQAMEAAGAQAVAVHGRTREDFYHGSADWDVIAQVKQAVSVPVIGSGDIFTADDVVRMLEHTGADAVMVARGAQGNPWIFREARALLDSGERVPRPTARERIETARAHARGLLDFAGERAVVRMRKHVAWYLAEMPGATHARQAVNECGSFDDLDTLLVEYRDYLDSRGALGDSPSLGGASDA